jgi:pimeloyl-ACP methyl ester carboxylesterase
MQIPCFARHGRVVTFDPPGNGRSDRPRDAAAYERSALAEYALAVLDAARVERAVVVSWCDMGESLILVAKHPDRASGVVFIAPALPVGEREVPQFPFNEKLETDEGWAKENRHYWLRDWRGYVEFFVSRMFTESHSTKQIEDCVGWGLETDADTMLVSFRGWDTKELDPATTVELCAQVRCPALVIHGTMDDLVEPERARAFASELGAEAVFLEGSGHGPHARDAVKINLLLRDFIWRHD